MPKMDNLPRVPGTHGGDIVDEKMLSDFYIRTSWVDANVALDQIEKVSYPLLILALSLLYKPISAISELTFVIVLYVKSKQTTLTNK